MGEARRRKLAGEGPRPESVNHSAARRINDRAALAELKKLVEDRAKETAAHTVPESGNITKVIKASGKE